MVAFTLHFTQISSLSHYRIKDSSFLSDESKTRAEYINDGHRQRTPRFMVSLVLRFRVNTELRFIKG